jgi:hypothetical protein
MTNESTMPSKKQCKPQDLIDLYEHDAIAIYPGEGEIGRGKEIATIVKNFFYRVLS